MIAMLAVTASLGLPAPSAPVPVRRSPWATINSCDPPTDPGTVGVRESVPNRFDAAQWARVRIQFFDDTRGAWRIVRPGGVGRFTKLSDGGGRVFGGTTFTLTQVPPGGSLHLRGLVDVEWRRGRRVVSRARVTTHGGHADPKDPLLALSAATCDIDR